MIPFHLWEEPEPGPPELIPGLLLRHGAFLLFGAKELGKTTILFELAHTLLTGEPLWGELTPSMTIPQAHYIMGEHHKELAKAQWRKMYGVAKIPFIGFPPGGHILFRGRALGQTIQALTQATTGSGAVFFDPLSAFMEGEGVENDSAVMRAVVNAMVQIANVGVALIAHHEGKPTYNPRSDEWVDASSPRGASAIGDAAASIWRLVKYRPGDLADRYRLVKWWYKGDAPAWYDLKRDPATLRHTLIKTSPRHTKP